jgi:hypothetical protein
MQYQLLGQTIKTVRTMDSYTQYGVVVRETSDYITIALTSYGNRKVQYRFNKSSQLRCTFQDYLFLYPNE